MEDRAFLAWFDTVVFANVAEAFRYAQDITSEFMPGLLKNLGLNQAGSQSLFRFTIRRVGKSQRTSHDPNIARTNGAIAINRRKRRDPRSPRMVGGRARRFGTRRSRADLVCR
jgi:hypothetical protein